MPKPRHQCCIVLPCTITHPSIKLAQVAAPMTPWVSFHLKVCQGSGNASLQKGLECLSNPKSCDLQERLMTRWLVFWALRPDQMEGQLWRSWLCRGMTAVSSSHCPLENLRTAISRTPEPRLQSDWPSRANCQKVPQKRTSRSASANL